MLKQIPTNRFGRKQKICSLSFFFVTDRIASGFKKMEFAETENSLSRQVSQDHWHIIFGFPPGPL